MSEEGDEAMIIQKEALRMLASKGLRWAFNFMGEMMKSCQRSVVPGVIGQNNKGSARFDLKQFGQNYEARSH